MNRIIFLFISIMVFSGIYSQQPLNHSKNVYASPEGKLFVNKDLPVYLWLSTSEDGNAQKFKLNSEVSKQYTNPMYFDTEGKNTVRSPWAVDTSTKQTIYPLQDIIFEVYTDSKPPFSSLKYGDAYVYKKDGKLYSKPGVEIEIVSVDALSGVESIYISLNKGSYMKYSEKIKLTDEKENYIQYYAVDNVGNVEKLKSVTIIIDGSSPKSTLEFIGDNFENVFSPRSKIKIISTDDNGVFATYFQIDSGQLMLYKYLLKMAVLSQGEHTLRYYSVDKIKNEEPAITYNLYVDKTAPTIVEELLGNSFISNGVEYSSGRTKFKITTFDNKAGVKEVFYSMNGGEYIKYDKPFYLDNSEGNLNIKTYAVDNVNNKSYDNSQSNTTVDIPYIDLSGPKLDYNFIGPMFVSRDTIFISKNSKINLLGKDPESGVSKIEYKIDDGQMQEYTEPFTLETQGVHNIYYTGVDNVNNRNQNELVVIVDDTGPEIFARYSIVPIGKKDTNSGIIDVYPGHVVLFLSSTDNYVGFEKILYSLNGGPEKLSTGIIDNFARGSDISINIKALDKLGNTTEKEVQFATSF